MNKIKTSKSMQKRFKITSGGKFLRRNAMKNHLLQKKSSKRKQKLRRTSSVYLGEILYFKVRLPYIN